MNSCSSSRASRAPATPFPSNLPVRDGEISRLAQAHLLHPHNTSPDAEEGCSMLVSTPLAHEDRLEDLEVEGVAAPRIHKCPTPHSITLRSEADFFQATLIEFSPETGKAKQSQTIAEEEALRWLKQDLKDWLQSLARSPSSEKLHAQRVTKLVMGMVHAYLTSQQQGSFLDQDKVRSPKVAWTLLPFETLVGELWKFFALGCDAPPSSLKQERAAGAQRVLQQMTGLLCHHLSAAPRFEPILRRLCASMIFLAPPREQSLLPEEDRAWMLSRLTPDLATIAQPGWHPKKDPAFSQMEKLLDHGYWAEEWNAACAASLAQILLRGLYPEERHLCDWVAHLPFHTHAAFLRAALEELEQCVPLERAAALLAPLTRESTCRELSTGASWATLAEENPERSAYLCSHLWAEHNKFGMASPEILDTLTVSLRRMAEEQSAGATSLERWCTHCFSWEHSGEGLPSLRHALSERTIRPALPPVNARSLVETWMVSGGELAEALCLVCGTLETVSEYMSKWQSAKIPPDSRIIERLADAVLGSWREAPTQTLAQLIGWWETWEDPTLCALCSQACAIHPGWDAMTAESHLFEGIPLVRSSLLYALDIVEIQHLEGGCAYWDALLHHLLHATLEMEDSALLDWLSTEVSLRPWLPQEMICATQGTELSDRARQLLLQWMRGVNAEVLLAQQKQHAPVLLVQELCQHLHSGASAETIRNLEQTFAISIHERSPNEDIEALAAVWNYLGKLAIHPTDRAALYPQVISLIGKSSFFAPLWDKRCWQPLLHKDRGVAFRLALSVWWSSRTTHDESLVFPAPLHDLLHASLWEMLTHASIGRKTWRALFEELRNPSDGEHTFGLRALDLPPVEQMQEILLSVAEDYTLSMQEAKQIYHLMLGVMDEANAITMVSHCKPLLLNILRQSQQGQDENSHACWIALGCLAERAPWFTVLEESDRQNLIIQLHDAMQALLYEGQQQHLHYSGAALWWGAATMALLERAQGYKKLVPVPNASASPVFHAPWRPSQLAQQIRETPEWLHGLRQLPPNSVLWNDLSTRLFEDGLSLADLLLEGAPDGWKLPPMVATWSQALKEEAHPHHGLLPAIERWAASCIQVGGEIDRPRLEGTLKEIIRLLNAGEAELEFERIKEALGSVIPLLKSIMYIGRHHAGKRSAWKVGGQLLSSLVDYSVREGKFQEIAHYVYEYQTHLCHGLQASLLTEEGPSSIRNHWWSIAKWMQHGCCHMLQPYDTIGVTVNLAQTVRSLLETMGKTLADLSADTLHLRLPSGISSPSLEKDHRMVISTLQGALEKVGALYLDLIPVSIEQVAHWPAIEHDPQIAKIASALITAWTRRYISAALEVGAKPGSLLPPQPLNPIHILDWWKNEVRNLGPQPLSQGNALHQSLARGGPSGEQWAGEPWPMLWMLHPDATASLLATLSELNEKLVSEEVRVAAENLVLLTGDMLLRAPRNPQVDVFGCAEESAATLESLALPLVKMTTALMQWAGPSLRGEVQVLLTPQGVRSPDHAIRSMQAGAIAIRGAMLAAPLFFHKGVLEQLELLAEGMLTHAELTGVHFFEETTNATLVELCRLLRVRQNVTTPCPWPLLRSQLSTEMQDCWRGPLDDAWSESTASKHAREMVLNLELCCKGIVQASISLGKLLLEVEHPAEALGLPREWVDSILRSWVHCCVYPERSVYLDSFSLSAREIAQKNPHKLAAKQQDLHPFLHPFERYPAPRLVWELAAVELLLETPTPLGIQGLSSEQILTFQVLLIDWTLTDLLDLKQQLHASEWDSLLSPPRVELILRICAVRTQNALGDLPWLGASRHQLNELASLYQEVKRYAETGGAYASSS